MTSLWHTDRVASTTPPGTVIDAPDPDIVVVGAGIIGLTTAVLLARAGKRVAVVEARYVGAGATGNTTGKLSVLQGSAKTITPMRRVRWGSAASLPASPASPAGHPLRLLRQLKELTTAIQTFITGWNDRCLPFVSTKTAEEILNSSAEYSHFRCRTQVGARRTERSEGPPIRSHVTYDQMKSTGKAIVGG